jgi:hypothetical protein
MPAARGEKPVNFEKKDEDMPPRIPQISSIKSRQIFMSQQLQDNLDLYAKYLSGKVGSEYESDDILSHLLLDEKKLSELQPKVTGNQSKASFRLAARAWQNLDTAVERTGLKIESVIEEVSLGLFKDRDFVAFKARLQAESQPPKPAAKRSKKAAAVSVSVNEVSE